MTKASGYQFLVYNLPSEIKIGIIAIAILVIFANDIYTAGAEALASESYNYVLIIPFIMAYLIYRKRRTLSAALPVRDDEGRGYLNFVVGISGLVSSLMIYVYGIYTTDALTYHLVALEIFLTSAILLLFNRQTVRTLAVPILLINAALPAAVTFGLSFWYSISLYSIYPAYILLKLLGFNVTFIFSLNAPTLQLIGPAGAFQFAVTEASSGIYSFVGFTVFALFVAYIARGPMWKKVVLFLIGYALLIPINIIREMILVTAANFWGLIAFDFFHVTSGVVLITIVTLVLLAIGNDFFHLDYFAQLKRKDPCRYCSGPSSAAKGAFCSNCGRFLKMPRGKLSFGDIIAVEALVMIFLLFFVSLAPAYVNAQTPSSVDISSNLTSQQALTFLPALPGYNLTYQGPDTQVQEQLGADAILQYTYSSPNSTFSAVVEVLTAYHTPDTSIVQHITNYGLQPYTIYTNTNVQIPVSQSATPLAGGFIAFRIPGTNQIESIMWWNLRSLFNFGTYHDYRTVQIWLIDIPSNQTQIPLVEQSQLPIASKIASWWEPKLAYSVIQTTLKQASLPLAGVAILPGAAAIGNEQLRKMGKRSKIKQTLLKKESPEAKLFSTLNSLNMGRHRGRATLDQVMSAYSSLNNESITFDESWIAMTYLEYLGLVSKKELDEQGEPVQVWQSLDLGKVF